MKKDAKIFVAGHAGLIGSAMCRLLEYCGFDRVVTAPHSRLDLRDLTRVADFFEETRPSFVVLAAGQVGGIAENRARPADFMEENITIQTNVLKAARKAGVEKLILFGSSCMYPGECPQPMAEDMLLSAKPEETSFPYAISKLAGVYLCLAYNKQYGGKRFIPVIPNSAYGQNDNFDPKSGHVLAAAMSRFHEAKTKGLDAVTLWGSGSPRREFVHADDIASACLHLLQQDVSRLTFPLNIGVGADITVRELAEKIAGVVGYKGRIEWDLTKPDGAPRKLLDSNRLQSFGWKPRISLNEGLRSTYEWYVKNVTHH